MSDLLRFQSLIKFESLEPKPLFKKFQEVISFPTWWYVIEAVFRTRNYETGLDTAILILKLTDTFKDKMELNEYELAKARAYYFILELLDKLDRIDDFMEVWGQLGKEAAAFINVIPPKPFPGVILKSPHMKWINGQFGRISWRKRVIEGKLARVAKGYKIQRHHTQEDLTDKEIQERFEFISNMARIGKRERDVRFW